VFRHRSPETGAWLDRLVPEATAIVAAKTSASRGGGHALPGDPAGAIGVPNLLGGDWNLRADIPTVPSGVTGRFCLLGQVHNRPVGGRVA
jgi:hypothetical protein